MAHMATLVTPVCNQASNFFFVILELDTVCTVIVAYFKSLLAVLAALIQGVHYKCIAVINNEPQSLPMDIKP